MVSPQGNATLSLAIAIAILAGCLVLSEAQGAPPDPAPARSLYIDCGSSMPFNDSKGRLWTKDDYFKGGGPSSLPPDIVQPRPNMLDRLDNVMKTFRTFSPNDDPPHYSIPAKQDAPYLLRLRFPFYNSAAHGDNLDSVFHVIVSGWLGPVNVSTVRYNESERGGPLLAGSWDVIILETILQAFDQFINITFEGPANISAIELIGLGYTAPAGVNAIVKPANPPVNTNALPEPGFNAILRLEHRINCGGPPVDNSLTEPFIWEGDSYFDPANTTNISSTAAVALGSKARRPPSAVLQSLRTSTGNLTYEVPVAPAPKYYITVWWNELEAPFNKTGRLLDILVNNLSTTSEASADGKIGSWDTKWIGTFLIAGARKTPGTIQIKSVPLPSMGDSPPILSALEVYGLIPWSRETNPVDGNLAFDLVCILFFILILFIVLIRVLFTILILMLVLSVIVDMVLVPPCVTAAPYLPHMLNTGAKYSNVTAVPGAVSTLPPEIANFTNLEALILAQLGLVGEIPDDWRRMRNLQCLDLRNNQLEGLIPDWLADLPRLEEVHLDNNKFSGPLPLRLAERLKSNFTFSYNYGICNIPGQDVPCPEAEPSLSSSGPPTNVIQPLIANDRRQTSAKSTESTSPISGSRHAEPAAVASMVLTAVVTLCAIHAFTREIYQLH
ncbi:hypothetical protein CBR_g20176 [Chara braunii]|uniref:Malectin-like domain-containing protein n=1 Tax=Chara braunii TaxID=69332 RepID=A0A388KZR7_CHABU|nr:hypothetical protein CBR_g20176 [Chara braunii]|eukprot:GBG75545.1 hypothetical protein CBR_g20176 [Chara braunii]